VDVVCSLQDHEQRSLTTGSMVGYLSPIRLQENMHKFVLTNEDRAKIEKDKTPEQVAEAVKELQRKYEDKYALYLGRAMLRYKYRDFILAPYNFG